ncbi:MAG TPA: regulatory protein RecX [Thermoanaerobaculia bacterium]|nr:regulatory protein RecX [Thermoanaerobaculia bacterium]
MTPHLTLVPDETDACMAAALRSLHHRWHAEKELVSKLERKGFGPDTVRLVVEKLEADGWIDDVRFAESLAIARARRGQGRQRILRELGNLGVARDIASKAVAAAVPEEAERQSLVELCRKKMRMMASRRGSQYLLEDEGRKKLTAYLLTRGYDYGEVSAVIRVELKTIEKD